MKKNEQPTRKEIQGLIDEFEKQEIEAEAELDVADDAVGDGKRRQIEVQKKDAESRGGYVLPRAPIFVLENTKELEHLKYERKRAVGKLFDLRKRIKLLRKALNLTPE